MRHALQRGARMASGSGTHNIRSRHRDNFGKRKSADTFQQVGRHLQEKRKSADNFRNGSRPTSFGKFLGIDSWGH